MSERDPVQAVAAAWTGGHICVFGPNNIASALALKIFRNRWQRARSWAAGAAHWRSPSNWEVLG